MTPLFRLVTGYYRVQFFSTEPERMLNESLVKNIPVWHIRRFDGGIAFSVSVANEKRLFCLMEASRKEGEAWEKTACGTLRLRELFGKRYGFFLGAGLFFLILFLSPQFIWSVEVSGNLRYTDEEMIAQLKEYGVFAGQRKRNLPVDEIALRYQGENHDFHFVGITLVGTRALVSVREKEEQPSVNEKREACNQVAEIYGKIVRYEVLEGQAAVVRGQEVREGDLLISGVTENKNGSFRVRAATGRVFAETKRIFEAEVPYEQEERVFTGREEVKREYEFLGFWFSLPTEKKCSFSAYETIESTENLTLWGRTLPIRCRERFFLEICEKKERVKVDRARNLAYDKYEQYKREILSSEDEITEETVRLEETETGIIITAELSCVENICREIPIPLVNPG